MKTHFVFLALLLAGHAEARPLRHAPRAMFTDLQERKVLEAVQEACNNTWCEGDYGYDFKKFHCERGSCQLDFEIVEYKKFDDNGNPDPSSAVRHAETCAYAPVRRLSDVLNPKKIYPTPKYFVALAKCMDQKAGHLESENPGKPGDPGSVPAPMDPDPNPDMPLPVETRQIPDENKAPEYNATVLYD